MAQRQMNNLKQRVNWFLPFNLPDIGTSDKTDKKTFYQSWNEHVEKKKNDGSTAKTAQVDYTNEHFCTYHLSPSVSLIYTRTKKKHRVTYEDSFKRYYVILH